MFDWLFGNKSRNSSDDWQDKIRGGQRRIDEREKQKSLEREARAERERLARIDALGRRFRCYICGQKATGPYSETRGGYDGQDEFTYEDWDKPDNLSTCQNCGRWVCFEDTCSISMHDPENYMNYYVPAKNGKRYKSGMYCKKCALRLFS